ncbi:MAG: DJ-1/PfpI family protein, partial [Gemmatimonadota bacterium]
MGPLSGLYETLTAFPLLGHFEPRLPEHPFHVEIIAPETGVTRREGGLMVAPSRTYQDIERTDVAVVPLMQVVDTGWETGRYAGLVEWLAHRHHSGDILASACTGVLLLAKTGLLDGHEATIHWAFASTFRQNFEQVRLRTREAFLTAGPNREFVMTGGV